MCGRYNLITDARALAEFFQLGEGLELAPRYNIAPSQLVAVVRDEGSGRHLAMHRWGLVPSWARDPKTGYRMINARAETVAEKPAFRAAFRRRRCLIPATGFYEWKSVPGGKQPYHIRIAQGRLFAFAGLWERWIDPEGSELDSCTIIVTSANETVSPIHDRMPVIPNPADYARWLDPDVDDPAELLPMLQACPSRWLESYPVPKAIGSPGFDGPECVEPLDVTR